MGLQNDRGRWYYVKRVPKRFAHLDPRVLVRVALRTDSQSEARLKAPGVQAELFAYWEALAAGRGDDAARRYDAARNLAAARGFTYRPGDEIAEGPLADIFARLSALVDRQGNLASPEEAAALLGRVERPPVLFSKALDEFFDLTTDRVARRSEAQVRRWKNPRLKAVRSFCAVIGDKAFDQISRDDALAFRRWWRDRLQVEGLDPSSANKDFQYLSGVFQTVSDLKGYGLDNPFRGLRFKENGARETYPFSEDWIRNRLLAPGAFDGLSAEARDVLLVMVNTGARPSEIVDARVEDFAVADPVPHLRVRAHDGRALKTDHSRRDLPLLGVSLEAARRLAAAGGATHYRGRTDTWSANVNKYLSVHGLRETPEHTTYSLRHSFESCVDAPDCARDFGTVRACDRVRSCVRPRRCGACRWPRAGMAIRGSGPNHASELVAL